MNSPASFDLSVTGPEGSYRLIYTAGGDEEGSIEVEIAGVTMTWFVEVVSQNDDGVTLSGMTTGSQSIWQNQFWFELRPEANPPRIEYWGNQVLWRTDLHLDA